MTVAEIIPVLSIAFLGFLVIGIAIAAPLWLFYSDFCVLLPKIKQALGVIDDNDDDNDDEPKRDRQNTHECGTVEEWKLLKESVGKIRINGLHDVPYFTTFLLGKDAKYRGRKEIAKQEETKEKMSNADILLIYNAKGRWWRFQIVQKDELDWLETEETLSRMHFRDVALLVNHLVTQNVSVK